MLGDRPDHLEHRGDRERQCQALDAHRPDQRNHQRDVDGDRDDGPRHRRPRVLHGIEGPRQHVDHDMADEADGEEEQRAGRSLGGRLAEQAVLVEDRRQRLAQHDHHRHQRRGNEDEHANGIRHLPPDLADASQRRILAERRKQRHGDADADDADRDLRQLERVVVGGQASFGQARGEHRADQEVQLARCQAQHARSHQQGDAPNAGVTQADGQVIALPHLRQVRQLYHQVRHGADRDADRQPFDAHDRRQEDGRADDGQVVEQRRDRRHGELLVAVQDAGHHRAHADQDRAEQHDPRHAHRQLGGRRVEPGRDDRHEQRREDRHQQAQRRERDEHQVDDAAGELPGLGVLPSRAIALEDGDECRAQRAGHHELEDGVRNAEGREIRVKLPAGAELRADDQQSDPAQEPAGERRGSEDEAGGDQDPTGRDPFIARRGLWRRALGARHRSACPRLRRARG